MMNSSPNKKSNTPLLTLPKLSSRKRSLTNPEVIRDFAAKQGNDDKLNQCLLLCNEVIWRFFLFSSLLFSLVVAVRAALKRKSPLDVVVEKDNSNNTKDKQRPIRKAVGASVTTNGKSPGLATSHSATITSSPLMNGNGKDSRTKKTPSPPLKPPKKLQKSANGIIHFSVLVLLVSVLVLIFLFLKEHLLHQRQCIMRRG